MLHLPPTVSWTWRPVASAYWSFQMPWASGPIAPRKSHILVIGKICNLTYWQWRTWNNVVRVAQNFVLKRQNNLAVLHSPLGNLINSALHRKLKRFKCLLRLKVTDRGDCFWSFTFRNRAILCLSFAMARQKTRIVLGT